MYMYSTFRFRRNVCDHRMGDSREFRAFDAILISAIMVCRRHAVGWHVVVINTPPTVDVEYIYISKCVPKG